ncbi:unnamed protein product [Tuber melanosporum]|uniref:threonine--tRNA ligase n=1 Tax=Tuber melanosporum (strain Mel28) TaxID=656061 RepID=D5GMC3_TUBMM|nr:uncharacterized protein GSTUM_00010648001 [Tuber melanosporum]CAZ85666.1 unnamed protein product [Tuber melanosporum]
MEKVDKVIEGVRKVALGEGSEKPAEGASQAPKAPKAGKKSKKVVASTATGPLELEPPPEYISHRIHLFEKLKAEYDQEVAAKPREDITISLPDGKVVAGKSWETTPSSIARGISKSLFEKTVIAKVDGNVWDLERPFEKSGTLELLDFEDPEGRRVFWHSSAHVLGEAAERRFGCHLCLGPPTDDGFFYEMGLGEGEVVTATDYKPLETIAQKAIKEKQPFERLIPDGTSTTVYRCGPLIDLCVGPHVPNTGRIKAFQVMKNSSSYFLGDAINDSLQRIYGVSFPDKKQLEEHKKLLEEAAKRDHRKIGKEQELFFFHELSPGSCFFLPHGTRIYNTLVGYLRQEYWKRGYEEVITPNMYNAKLWETSGHWQNYQENMFTFEVEKDKYGLKPMNCPGHCLLFGHRERSYRELPWRVADFGVIHRNEFSGALTGLTRVRRFQQDDTHVFCTEEQVGSEIHGLFDFLKTVYGLLGFTFKLKLSTRPEKFVGDIATWDSAEAQLTKALDEFTAGGGGKWEMNPGDGAFYGPKIDITISDALRREHQSILGSVERFIAILTEHFGGKWPFWLSPRQILVIPVMAAANNYVLEIQKLRLGLDSYNSTTLSLAFVGAEEEESRSVNIRNRDNKETQNKGELVPIDVALEKLCALRDERRVVNEL